MLWAIRHGVTLMQEGTKANIDWASDLVIKGLCVAATGLLGVAVSSLQSMNAEIKQLSASVYSLGAETKVVNVTVIAQEKRLDKLEAEMDVLKKVQSHPPK